MKIIEKNIIYLLFYGLIISCNSDNNIPSVKNKYQDLVKIFQDFRVIQKPSITHGVPDYSPKAMAHQKASLDNLQAQLALIDTEGWSVSDRVEYQ